jgi:hypothetical protein
MQACRASIDCVSRTESFFVSVNLRRALARLSDSEYEPVAAAIEQSRRKLHFLFLGYALMPDHGHALIWPAHPRPINGILVAITVMNCTLASRGRFAMYRTASATCRTSILGSTFFVPSA